jgi:hypothetical protein
MAHHPSTLLGSSKGISIIGILILVAVIVAALNIYAYFNPDFELSKYSFVRFMRSRADEQRKEDLAKIKEAVDTYYAETGEYPAPEGWCGRIVTVLHPEVKNAIGDYFEKGGIPQDSSFQGTHKDYLYNHVDRDTYILLAVLENQPEGSPTYDFVGCHDWPGDGIYNYRVVGGT